MIRIRVLLKRLIENDHPWMQRPAEHLPYRGKGQCICGYQPSGIVARTETPQPSWPQVRIVLILVETESLNTFGAGSVWR